MDSVNSPPITARVTRSNLVKLLSRMPFDQVVPGAGQQGVLSVLQLNQENTSFSCLVVVDETGRQLADVSGSGVTAPATPLPSGWQRR